MKSTAEILKLAKEQKSATQVVAPLHNREAVISLLKEYTSKLEDFGEQAKELRESAAAESSGNSAAHGSVRENIDLLKSILDQRIQGLDRHIHNLSRAVSQLIEHARFETPIEKVELTVRLADLEGALRATQSLIGRPLPKSRSK